ECVATPLAAANVKPVMNQALRVNASPSAALRTPVSRRAYRGQPAIRTAHPALVHAEGLHPPRVRILLLPPFVHRPPGIPRPIGPWRLRGVTVREPASLPHHRVVRLSSVTEACVAVIALKTPSAQAINSATVVCA